MSDYLESLKQKAIIKTCMLCGKTFECYNNTAKYCEKCKPLARKITNKKYMQKKYPKTEKSCLFCHRKFLTRQVNHQRFCSETCAFKYRRILQKIYKIRDYYGSQFDFEQDFKAKGKNFRFPSPFTWLNEWFGLEGETKNE